MSDFIDIEILYSFLERKVVTRFSPLRPQRPPTPNLESVKVCSPSATPRLSINVIGLDYRLYRALQFCCVSVLLAPKQRKRLDDEDEDVLNIPQCGLRI